MQALVAPSAQEGLARMLSSLKQPTRFRVVSGAAMGDATEVDNDGPPSYTLRMTDQLHLLQQQRPWPTELGLCRAALLICTAICRTLR